MCQDKNENKPEDESLSSLWIKPVTNEPGLSTYDTLKDRFFHHTLASEQTKAVRCSLESSWKMCPILPWAHY